MATQQPKPTELDQRIESLIAARKEAKDPTLGPAERAAAAQVAHAEEGQIRAILNGK